MNTFVGAIDQGTTSTRFIVFDQNARIVASAQKEHQQIFSRPGWSEHDPTEIWKNTEIVVADALSLGNLKAQDLAAVGIANQMRTTVAWDHEGNPRHNAIVWNDTRTAELAADLAQRADPECIRAKTGMPLAPMTPSLFIKWLLQHLDNAQEQSRCNTLLFGTIDSWLLWNLTGEHITDITNASLTQLVNLSTLDWDAELLEIFGIPRNTLPKIVSSSAVYGTGRGVLEGVPIAGAMGDARAALLGHTCVEPGEAHVIYGTASTMVMNTGLQPAVSASGMVSTVAYRLRDDPARFALVGPIGQPGALVNWLRDNLNLIRSTEDLEALASSVPDNGGVYIVPAFSGLWAPHFRHDVRGLIDGLTGFAHSGHIARAALESAAYQTHDVVKAMEGETNSQVRELRVSGGMSKNNLLMQFQSDILNIPVVRPKTIEMSAMGAAFAAGIAVGVWKGLSDLPHSQSTMLRWTPSISETQRSRLVNAWRKTLKRALIQV